MVEDRPMPHPSDIAFMTEMENKIRPQEDYLCQFCKKSLRGDEIPKQDRHLFGTTHFGKEIAIYDRGRDRTVAFECPFCQTRWDRDTGKKL